MLNNQQPTTEENRLILLMLQPPKPVQENKALIRKIFRKQPKPKSRDKT